MTMSYVPAIDISLLNSRAGRASVVAEVTHALEHVGFMCIIGHAIPADLLDQMQAFTKAFFTLSDGIKRSLLRTSFNNANPNHYKGYFPLEETADNRKEG